jgi:hypothetical protein
MPWQSRIILSSTRSLMLSGKAENCLYEKWIIGKSPKTEILENLAVEN